MNHLDQGLGGSLIFIISQPRAGSTLLQRILGGHPLIFAPDEPWALLHPLYALREHGHSAEYGAQYAYLALLDFLELHPEGKNAYMNGLRKLFLELYQDILHSHQKSIFLDKTPKYYYILPELQQLFPQARFIYLFRNPLAVFSSILETWLHTYWGGLHERAHDLLLAPQQMVAASRAPGSQSICIRYEDLVQDPESTVAGLCQQLAIPYQAEMLQYNSQPGPKGKWGDPVGIKQHDAPVTVSLDKWVSQVHANPQVLHLAHAYLEALGPDLVSQMGYDYTKLKQQLKPVTGRRGAFILPWELLIKPAEQRTVPQRLWIRFASSVQRRGIFQTLTHSAGKVFSREPAAPGGNPGA